MTTPHNPPAWARDAAHDINVALGKHEPFSLAAIIAKHAPQPDAPTSGPEARPIGSLNAEEAEAMVDKFNAAPVTAKTGNFVCINEEDGGCSNKKCAEVGYCIDSYNALCGLKLKQVRDAALSLAGLPQAPSATPQPGPTPETDAEWERYVRNGEHDAGQHFARRLERERDEARRDAAELREEFAKSDAVRLMAELERANHTLEAYRKRARKLYTPEVAATKIAVEEENMRDVDHRLEVATSILKYYGLEVVSELAEGVTLLMTDEDKRGTRAGSYVRSVPGGRFSALRQDRDGLAALCEELRTALMDEQPNLLANGTNEQWDKWNDRRNATLALTPAEALARQREKEKAT